MKALIYSRNLLGDGLQAGPAIKSWYEIQKSRLKKGEELLLTIATLPDYTRIIYERFGIPTQVITLGDDEIDETQYDFVFWMDISRAWQIGMPTGKSAASSYAIMLGVPIPNSLPIYEVPQAALDAAPHDFVLFQPYSKSCSSHTNEPANKRWFPDENWGRLYARVRERFPHLEIRVLGGKTDPFIPHIPEDEHWLGRDFDTIAATQKKAALVVTIDSGPAHLAASQQARTVEFYPTCLPIIWMGKAQNPNWQCIYARPAELPVDYVWQVVERKLVGYLEEDVGLLPDQAVKVG